MFDPEKCSGCPIEGMYQPVDMIGDEKARFFVVTDVPSPNSAKEGRLLPPGAGKVFARKMAEKGFSQEDFQFAPACFCPYDQDAHHNKVKKHVHKHCRDNHLSPEIHLCQPEVIIPLGALPASQVFGTAVKITKVKGMAHESKDFMLPVFPLMNPTQVTMYPQNEPIFSADVASFGRYVDAGYDKEAAAGEMFGDYQIVEDLEFLIERKPEIISFDIESTGLRWYQSGVDVRTYDPEKHHRNPEFKPRLQILTMQFTTAEGEGYMLVWDHPENPIPEDRKPKLRNQIRRLLCNEDTLVVGQNVKIDNVFLWMLEGIRFRIGGDTIMLATLTDENMPEKNLDTLIKIFVPEMAGYADIFNAEVDKSRMWEVPLQKMLPYGCGDTDAALRLYNVLEPMVMEDEGQWNHYCHVTVPGLNALASMETQGMFCDQDNALADFKSLMIREVNQKERELLHAVPRSVKRDVAAEYTKKNKGAGATEKALKLTRAEFLKQILFYHPDGFCLEPKVFTKTTAKLKDESLREPSVSAKDHLPYFFDTCPFTQELAEYIKDESLLTKSVISFETNYIHGGKVRPTYHLHKAVTGRTSSDDPNGQNYPKRGERALTYRKMFVAPPGYFVCELDLSQAELRIAASMAGDKTMLDIYRNAGDIHTATALIVLGTTMEKFRTLPKAEQKDARTKAKSVNFGFLYGMGWRKFIGFAKTQYGVTFTEKEAKRVRAGFFTKYAALPRWHERTRAFAAKHKFVRSYSGRIRHLPMVDSAEEYIQQEAMRQAINSPVQEFGSSLGVMALGRMNEEIDSEYLKVVGFIHDAIVVYVKKEYLDWGMRTVKEYMQSNPLKEWFGTELKCPIVADCGFGHNLGEIHECEGFKLDEDFDYWGEESPLWNKKTNSISIEVPDQEIPPNNGRATRSVYTLPTDLEDEAGPGHKTHARIRRTRTAPAAAKKVLRRTRKV